MRKTILLLTLTVALMARAQGDKVIRTVDFGSAVTVEEQLGSEWQRIDSLVLMGMFSKSVDMASIEDCLRKGNVSGLNASQVQFENDELPEEWLGYQLRYSALRHITLPSTLKLLGWACLAQCTITELGVPEGVTELAPYSLFQCRNLRRLQLPSTLTTIGEDACYELTSLEELVLPEQLQTIGDEAFCKLGGNVAEVVIPFGVTSLGKMAFWKCSGLQRVVLPERMKRLYTSTFAGDDAVVSFTCLANVPPIVEEDIIGLPLTCATLFVPEASVEAYRSAFYWSDFGKIEPIHTTGISRSEAAVPTVVACYSLQGHSLPAPRSGLNIVRRSDGTVHKVFISNHF